MKWFQKIRNFRYFLVMEYGWSDKRGPGGMIMRPKRCYGIFWNLEKSQEFAKTLKPSSGPCYIAIHPKFPIDEFIRSFVEHKGY